MYAQRNTNIFSKGTVVMIHVYSNLNTGVHVPFPPEGKNLDDSITSSLSTSTGLSSSHSTVESISCKTNRPGSRDVQSPPMNSTFLDKESMIANFGDSRVGNSLEESSFPSIESGSFTVVTHAEDSGIDDRSASLEKVRLEVEEDSRHGQRDGPVAVSSPADGASTPLADSQGQEKESLPGSFSSCQNEKEVHSKENKIDNELKPPETSSEGIYSR